MSLRRATFHIDSHELVGERLRVDGYLSRTGVQVYSDGMGGIRREYRAPTEVFDEASLSSFRGMPVTIKHPDSMVTANNWRTLSVGHVGDDPHRADDGKHVAASLWILDSNAIKLVQDKNLQELSVGYLAALDETSGTSPEGEHYDAEQTEIRGNHVALLEAGQARGGRSVRLRLDSAGDALLTDDELEEKMKFKITADGLSFDVEATDENVCRALEKERADSEKILKDAEDEKSKVEAKADATSEQLVKVQAELDAFKSIKKDEILAALKANALKIAPKLSIQDSDTLEQIRRNALDEAGIKTDGKDDAYVAVRFDMALETPETPEVSAVEKARKQDTQTQDAPMAQVFSIDEAARALR